MAEQPTIPTDPLVGKATGMESSLSTWAGPYVTDMLGKGAALSELPYTAYTGPLTAGSSPLQQQAFQGLGSFNAADFIPAADEFTPRSYTDEGIAQQFMSPFVESALNPVIDRLRREAEINRVNMAGRMTKAGAFGGSRQAVNESLNTEALMRQIAETTGLGYQQAYESGRSQFNTEEERRRAMEAAARQFGLDLTRLQTDLGGVQRNIESEGIAADIRQFEEERDYPYKQVQFQQSLLQGLPLETQSYNYMEPGVLNQALGTYQGLADFLATLFGGDQE